jgi:predicted aspartyl protease
LLAINQIVRTNGLLLFLFLILTAFVEAGAEEKPLLPLNLSNLNLPSLTSTIKADTPSCVIPFSRAGNLILVKAKVDSTEGSFILDTGAPHLVLNITYFRDYPQTEHTDTEQSAITGVTASSVIRTQVEELSFGTYHYYKQEADLINMAHIENSKGIKVLGLLGMDLFKQFEMIIDFEKGLIYLHLIDKKEAKTYQHQMLTDATSYRTIPIELKDNRILLQAEIGGKKLKMVVDCAAEASVLDSRLPDKVFDNFVISRRVKLAGAGNQKVDALYGDLAGLKIAGQEARNIPVLITNLEKTCFSYAGCVDGVLGFDFLSIQKVGFNFVTRKMFIWK